MNIGEKLAKLPRDGKHFTPEELMEEKLNNTVYFKPVYPETISNDHTAVYSGNITLRRTNSYGLDDTYQIVSGDFNGHTTSHSTNHYDYTIDPDLIEDIEDVKAVLKALDKKLLSFKTRSEVVGIEHLVVKNV